MTATLNDDGLLVVDEHGRPVPGPYDWTAEQYHGDPLRPWGGSASSSVLRHILWPDGSPARVKWEAAHPPTSDAMDEGTVAHRMVLGKGGDVFVVDAPDWRTKAAQQARDAARARGATPVLRKTFAKARRMAHALLRHPDTGPLFDGRHGVPERSVMWVDDVTGAYCRAMLDVFPHLHRTRAGRPFGVDVKKTAAGLDDRSLARTVLTYRLDQQADHYLTGLEALGLEDPDLLFAFVQSRPPHEVRLVSLQDWRDRGRRLNRMALDLWDRCRDLGTWPRSWAHGLTHLAVPPWADDYIPGEDELAP